MDKAELLTHLRERVFARIGLSGIHGFGIIAIRDIAGDTDPFPDIRPVNYVRLTEEEVGWMDVAVAAYIKDICIFREGNYLVPDYGLNGLDISWYLNHSEEPNLQVIDGYLFRTLRRIHAGEELTVDYNSFCGGKEAFR